MSTPIYVAIPVYNGGKTIRETLTNILAQTWQDFQVLVYDDGSTDRTAQIVSQFVRKDGRVTLISGDVNVGRGGARNRLLQAAKDGIIAWQDADDSWSPEKLTEQIRVYDSWADQGIDPSKAIMISTFRRTVMRKDKEVVTKHVPPDVYDVNYVFSEEYNQCPFQLQATFGLAQAYIDAGGFDENLNWSEDIDIALKILRHGSRIIPHQASKALATYHHSLSGAKGDVVQRAQDTILTRYRDFAQEHGFDLDRIFMKRRLNYLFNIYVSNKNYAKALAITLETICEDDSEKAQLVARNIIAVIRALAPEPVVAAAEEAGAGGQTSEVGAEPATAA
jgi:glycosyltransferase involved in cell wall biosynthesis